jgi:hypothetical protein
MICQKCNNEMAVDEMMRFRYGILEYYCIYDGYRAGEGYGTYTIEDMERVIAEERGKVDEEEYHCQHCGDLLEGRYRSFTLYCKKPECQEAKKLKWAETNKKLRKQSKGSQT